MTPPRIQPDRSVAVELKNHASLVVFVGIYGAGFLAFGFGTGQPNTTVYAVVTAFLVGVFTIVHAHVRLPDRLLWALALLGLLHMAGGIIPAGSGRILYNVPLWPFPLQVDRLVHLYGSVLVTFVAWRIVEPRIRPLVPVDWTLLLLVVMAGMGAGGVEELSEFASTRVATTNVGGYVNTGWDLTFDFAGCLLAAIWIRHRAGRAPAFSMPEEQAS